MNSNPDSSAASQSNSKRHLSSTTSYQSIVQADLDRLTKDTSDKIADYLFGQIAGTIEDFKLMEEMNSLVLNRYGGMKDLSGGICTDIIDVNNKYANMQPYLAQIDEIEKGIKKLEIAACTLDTFVKSLESKLKHLTMEKR